MAVHLECGDTSMRDERLLDLNVGYFAVLLLSDMIIGCAITT